MVGKRNLLSVLADLPGTQGLYDIFEEGKDAGSCLVQYNIDLGGSLFRGTLLLILGQDLEEEGWWELDH